MGHTMFDMSIGDVISLIIPLSILAIAYKMKIKIEKRLPQKEDYIEFLKRRERNEQ